MFKISSTTIIIFLSVMAILNLGLAISSVNAVKTLDDCYAEATILLDASLDNTQDMADEVMDSLSSIIQGQSPSSYGIESIGDDYRNLKDQRAELDANCS